MVDRMVLVESWAIEGSVATLWGDSLTSVDWRSVALGKIGEEVVSGDTMIVKSSVTDWTDCPACLLPLRTIWTSTPEMFS